MTHKNPSLKIEENGTVAFSLNDQGAWSTSGPLFILHYYDRQHPRAQAALIPSSEGYAFGTAGTISMNAQVKLTLQRDEGEVKASVAIENIGISLVIYFRPTPTGDGFDVVIPPEEISETMPRLYRILDIEILPEFGAARTGEAGYLTLPNWSGCQTFFNKSYPREVWQTVYSSNDEWEHVCNMGFYGITRAHGTLCAYIAQGDCDARFVSRVHWEQDRYNSTHSSLVYRWQQQDEIIPGPREVRYRFAPADYPGGEGYVFCAKTYRDFLYAERGLQTWKQKGKKRPIVLDWRDRFFLKIFMAYKDPAADGHGTYHASTTFAEAREILEDCLKRGIKKLHVTLVGWGKDGHDGMPPTRFPVDERLGGESEMKRLITWCKEHDIILGVHDSYGASYTCSPEFNTGDLIRHRTGEYWESIIWSGGQAHLICPKVYIDKHVRRDIPAIRRLGIYGHHHIDAVGSFMTCYAKDHPLERRADFINEVTKMFKIAIEEIGSVSTEYPFGPYFPVLDGIYHTYTKPSSWHRACPVGRFLLDRTLPLVPLVLHGSVNCYESIGKITEPLHWLDQGMVPQWEVCGNSSKTFGIPSYAAAADRLAKVYEQHFGANGIVPRLNSLLIEGRWELAEGVTKTLYSDGVTLWVNQTRQPYKDLEPLSYRLA